MTGYQASIPRVEGSGNPVWRRFEPTELICPRTRRRLGMGVCLRDRVAGLGTYSSAGRHVYGAGVAPLVALIADGPQGPVAIAGEQCAKRQRGACRLHPKQMHHRLAPRRDR